MTNTPHKVLFVLGSSRSGSTILDNILGEVEGVFSGGEIRFLWERLQQGRHCGCGNPLSGCRIWSRVLAEAFTGTPLEGIPADDLLAWQRKAVRLHHTPALLLGRPRSPALSSYLQAIALVYSKLAEITGAGVIVDSSKRPSNGALLRLIPSIQPYFVHIVRDPRAMAYSQSRRKVNPDRSVPGEMPTEHPVVSMMHWNATNLAADLVRGRVPKEESMLVRYEDFVENPRGTVQAILDMVGETGQAPFLDAHHVALGDNHTVSGNPSRFETGTVQIKRDDRWVTGMSTPHRLMTTTMAWPLMLRYGYQLRKPQPSVRA